MESQKIVLYGASTEMGERILNEALDRGHRVTAIVPQPGKFIKSRHNLTILQGEAVNKNDVRSKIKGTDVVISAYTIKADPLEHYRDTTNLINAVQSDDVRQLIVLGYPGTNETEPTIPIPANNEDWKAISQAQRKTLDALENETNFRWSYIHHPAITDKPGKPEQTNKVLIKNSESEQYCSSKNIHKAVIDEAEHFTEVYYEL